MPSREKAIPRATSESFMSFTASPNRFVLRPSEGFFKGSGIRSGHPESSNACRILD